MTFSLKKKFHHVWNKWFSLSLSLSISRLQIFMKWVVIFYFTIQKKIYRWEIHHFGNRTFTNIKSWRMASVSNGWQFKELLKNKNVPMETCYPNHSPKNLAVSLKEKGFNQQRWWYMSQIHDMIISTNQKSNQVYISRKYILISYSNTMTRKCKSKFHGDSTSNSTNTLHNPYLARPTLWPEQLCYLLN